MAVMERFTDVTKLPAGLIGAGVRRLWTPRPPSFQAGQKEILKFDPRIVGYDGVQRDVGGIVTQESQLLDYSSGGTDSVELSKDRVITGLMLVADPYRHDVTTAVIVPVQDAADKVLSGLSISGKSTYFQLSSTLAFLKALSNLNKLVYPGLIHEDLATAVAADNDSRQAWYIPFGVLNDWDPYDVSAGIPAEDMASLLVNATFGTSQIIAETAANGTVDAATDIYVVTWGVQGLSKGYRRRLPIPEFRHDHITAPTTTSVFQLQAGRYLKRTTILNLAVAASNNEARNDSNITDITIQFRKPTLTNLVDLMRWRVFKAAMQPFERGAAVDKDGSVAVVATGIPGVAVIDWRKLTHNPYGLNLYPFSEGDVRLSFTMGTTTGSIHLYNEYYTLPDPSIAERWPAHGFAYRPQQARS